MNGSDTRTTESNHVLSAVRLSISEILTRGTAIPIILLLEQCLEEAYTERASDIHIDTQESDICIRFRIDGLLQQKYSFPKSILSEIIARIKVLAQLRTDEHHTAQDGRFRMTMTDSATLDIRVSIVPAYQGETAVLRLLAPRTTAFTLASLGLHETDQATITHALQKKHGMILATGPTGSGKTTTLYTLIHHLRQESTSMITIEDPIEYAIPGITQIQINPRSNLTFASGLRSILRQDPDNIMVGEIRDTETASIAINTALTGHLLLSTLHTNSAATTLPRLLDMGIDAYLVAATVNIAIAQRLVRILCTTCKTKRAVTTAERESFTSLIPDTLHTLIPEVTYEAVGCAECHQHGYRGRIGIYEVLAITPRIRTAILERQPASVLQELATKEGMTTMLEDGLRKARSGTTTMTEVLRAVTE
jgi:type II secretory ATPase GspE/PulE/Tfp pilus assembly ATPase PilB-like protein